MQYFVSKQVQITDNVVYFNDLANCGINIKVCVKRVPRTAQLSTSDDVISSPRKPALRICNLVADHNFKFLYIVSSES